MRSETCVTSTWRSGIFLEDFASPGSYLVLVYVEVPYLRELAQLGGDSGTAPEGGTGENRGLAQHLCALV